MPSFTASDLPAQVPVSTSNGPVTVLPSIDNDLSTPIDADDDGHVDPVSVENIKGSGGARPEIFGPLGLTVLLWQFY